MDKIKITSLQNPMIKQIKELQLKKAARKKQGLFIVEGIRAVKEIPYQEGIIAYLVITEKLVAEIPEHLKDIKCLVVTEDVFSKISETQSPQGILAVVKLPHYTIEQLILEKGKYLILENLQDPGNLGTIIRTAHAFNFKGILMTKGCADPFAPKVVRATMSSLFYVPLIVDLEIEKCISFFKEEKIPLYVTALNEASQPIQQLTIPEVATLVIGNEGNGVTPICIEQADQTMIIPMPGGAESLNASVAAAICMYQMTCH